MRSAERCAQSAEGVISQSAAPRWPRAGSQAALDAFSDSRAGGPADCVAAVRRNKRNGCHHAQRRQGRCAQLSAVSDVLGALVLCLIAYSTGARISLGLGLSCKQECPA